jgi:hypothetical protein
MTSGIIGIAKAIPIPIIPIHILIADGGKLQKKILIFF